MPLTDEEAGRMLPAEINTEENRMALIAAGANAWGVGRAFAEMHRASPALITPENRQALLSSSQFDGRSTTKPGLQP